MNTTHSDTGSGTTFTQNEVKFLIAAAFDAATDELEENKDEIEEIRQFLREIYGAKKDSPLDFMFTGFVLGFAKGLPALTGSTD